MKLTLEQFETQFADNNLSVTDWFDTTYGLFKELEALQQPKSCDGCIRLPFILIELAKRDGGKCGTCKRFVKDHYELEQKEQ